MYFEYIVFEEGGQKKISATTHTARFHANIFPWIIHPLASHALNIEVNAGTYFDCPNRIKMLDLSADYYYYIIELRHIIYRIQPYHGYNANWIINEALYMHTFYVRAKIFDKI